MLYYKILQQKSFIWYIMYFVYWYLTSSKCKKVNNLKMAKLKQIKEIICVTPITIKINMFGLLRPRASQTSFTLT